MREFLGQRRALILWVALLAVGGVSAWLLNARHKRSIDRERRLAEFNIFQQAKIQEALSIVERKMTIMSRSVAAVARSGFRDFANSGLLDAPILSDKDSYISKKEASILREVAALPGSDAERMKALNAWISSSMAMSSSEEELRKDSLDSMVAACGHRDLIFAKIANQLRIPARRISFFNVPIQLGHATTEVFVDGNWIFFDSTAGIYFSHRGDDQPIGIAEARSAFPEIDVWRADVVHGTGRWQPMSLVSYSKLSGNLITLPDDPSLPVIDIKRTYFASDMGGAAEQLVHFTQVMVDTKTTKELRLGEKNGSPEDLISQSSLYLPLLERIGLYDSLLTGQEFTFVTDEVRRARVVVGYTEKVGEFLSDLDHAGLVFGLGETSIEILESDREFQFDFEIRPPYSKFRLWSRGKNMLVVDNYRISIRQ